MLDRNDFVGAVEAVVRRRNQVQRLADDEPGLEEHVEVDDGLLANRSAEQTRLGAYERDVALQAFGVAKNMRLLIVDEKLVRRELVQKIGRVARVGIAARDFALDFSDHAGSYPRKLFNHRVDDVSLRRARDELLIESAVGERVAPVEAFDLRNEIDALAHRPRLRNVARENNGQVVAVACFENDAAKLAVVRNVEADLIPVALVQVVDAHLANVGRRQDVASDVKLHSKRQLHFERVAVLGLN